MNNKKIVFLDIDGTLYDNELKQISEKTITALKLAYEQGVDLFIASGRASYAIEHLSPILGYIRGFVLLNGQQVIFNNETKYVSYIDDLVVKNLYDYTSEKGIVVGFVKPTGTYVTFTNDLTKNAFDHFNIDNVYSIEEIHKDFTNVCQMWVFDTAKSIDETSKHFKELNFMKWGNYGCDVVPNGVSKENGIKKVFEILGYKFENSYAFGNGDNDTAMFDTVKYSIAMEESSKKALEHAKYVTTNIQNGIYDGFVKFNIIK